MKIEDKTNYILISPEENTFLDFMSTFSNEHDNLRNKHLIIKILGNFNASKENISLFLKYSNEHQNNGTSFVIISKNVNVDDFPETFNIVPTLVEAEDVIEMENIQRDLGF